MSSPLSRSLQRFSSSTNSDELEAKVVEKQGIVTILGSDCERSNAASLRRTLSADMSSKKWLAQNWFSPMKKIASSERISASLVDSSSSSDYEERKKAIVGRGQFDMWSSILPQKSNDVASPPYIHPLVKRSASSLSEKSLQICTESLGSETGSDGFSSYLSSETGDAEDEKEEEEEEEEQQVVLQEDLKMYNHYASSCKKISQPRSFPPPLPSLSREDGASLRMESRRDNGRLVLEAVSTPSQNRFRAQRQDGRLVLTFVNSTTLSNEASKYEGEEEENEDFEEELGEFEEVYDDDDDDDDQKLLTE